MRPEPSSNARQAALTLHAMAPHDAAWLLQQLPVAEGAELQPLLEELRSLGIPSDPRLLDDLRQSAAREGDSASIGYVPIQELSLEGLIRELDAAHTEVLLPILKSEPAALMAFLLSLKFWSWSDSLLAALETHRRLSLRLQTDRLGAAADVTHAKPTQLQFTLLRCLLERYRIAAASMPSQNTPAMRPGSFARWWQERRRFWSSIVAPMKAYK